MNARIVLCAALVLAACARSSLDVGPPVPPATRTQEDAAIDARTDAGMDGATTTPQPDAAPPASQACGEGATRCAQACVDTRWDPAHCGGCDLGCASGQRCDDGVCSGCADDELVCGARCVDPLRDARHCGATLGCGAPTGSSGTQCSAQEACVDARCVDCPLFVGPRAVVPGRRVSDVQDFDDDGIGDLLLESPPAIVYSDGAPLTHASRMVSLQLPGNAIIWPGDLDGDGDLDIVSSVRGDVIGVLLLEGAGLATEVLQAEPIAYGRVLLGAWDGDAALDIVRVDPIDGSVQVHLGRGDGTFGEPHALGQVQPPADGPLYALDVTGDGRLDLVLRRDNDMVVYPRSLGALAGFDAEVSSYVNDFAAWEAMFADLDGDGLLDCIVQRNAVFLGTGDGAFVASELVLPGSADSHVAADFDADGTLDLAFFAAAFGLQVWLGEGDARFSRRAAYASRGYSLFAADMNADSRVDLVVHGLGGDGLPQTLVFEGYGDGTFEGASVEVGVEGRGFILPGDFDGDGNLDLYRMLETDHGNDGSWVEDYERFMGDGAGGFVHHASTSLPLPSYSDPLLAADLSGDGRTDVIANIDNYDRERTDVGVLIARADGTLATIDIHAGLRDSVHGRAELVDIDGDGVMDLSAPGGLGVRFMLGRSDGRFGEAILGEEHGLLHAQLVSDLTGDRRADLLQLPHFEALLASGNGDGSFEPAAPLAALEQAIPDGAVVISHDVFDANADGLPDLIVVETLDGKASITTLHGRGGGAWAEPIRATFVPPSGRVVLSRLAVDLDSDGLRDPVLCDASGSAHAIALIADGQGHYRDRIEIMGCAEPLAQADLDGDGVRDLICSVQSAPTSFMVARGLDRSACGAP
jgi:hypothetical protein